MKQDMEADECKGGTNDILVYQHNKGENYEGLGTHYGG